MGISFMRPMHPIDDEHTFFKHADGDEIYRSIKHDGWRMQVVVDGDRVACFGMSGKEIYWPGLLFREYFQAIAKGLVDSGHPHLVRLDGELVHPDGFEAIATAIAGGDGRLKFMVFDLPEHDGPFGERYGLLRDALDGMCCGDVELVEHELMRVGLEEDLIGESIPDEIEGYVYKTGSHLYIDGIHSPHWLRRVHERTIDLVCVGVREGEGQHRGMVGSFACEHNGRVINVLPGFLNHEQRERFFQWPPRVIEVRYRRETSGGSLRHAVFYRHRADKE